MKKVMARKRQAYYITIHHHRPGNTIVEAVNVGLFLVESKWNGFWRLETTDGQQWLIVAPKDPSPFSSEILSCLFDNEAEPEEMYVVSASPEIVAELQEQSEG